MISISGSRQWLHQERDILVSSSVMYWLVKGDDLWGRCSSEVQASHTVDDKMCSATQHTLQHDYLRAVRIQFTQD